MIDPTRRDFLISGGMAAASAMLARLDTSVRADDASRPSSPAPPQADAIPPHRALAATGVHLYTDRTSYRAGETITAFASTTLPCQLQVVRLGEDPDNPASDDILHTVRIDRPAMQPVHPGSYLHIEKSLPSEPLSELTLECWVRLWNLHEVQGVITQLNDATGMGLLVFPDGSAALFTGETPDPANTTHRSQVKLTLPGNPTFNPYVTPPANWHHLVAVLGGGRKSLWLDGRKVGEWPWKLQVAPADCPLRIGALGRDGLAAGFLDADIAMPAVYGRALTEVEIRTRHAERGLLPPRPEAALWGAWPLADEQGNAVADVSEAARTARIVNDATWMIGGPSFLPAIARYRHDYVPAEDPTRGHGLRLASDDLYDCRWQPTFTFTLPHDARPGLYALRGRFSEEGSERLTHAVFVVRNAATAPKAPIALMFATNTWKAYSAASFGPAWPGVFANVGTRGYQPKPADPLAAYCFYRFHRAGQPGYKIGWRLPWPAASPYALVSPPEVGYGHVSRADRFTQLWLEQNGYRYDALSDRDLHRDAEALEGVKVLFIVGHNEYWTRESMQRVRDFLDRGGNVVCLSGNTMYWRVTHSDDDAVIECRKADAWGAALADYSRGECWHEHDQMRGGVPRDCGHPEWQTLGVEFASAGVMNNTAGGAFHVVDATHPFFHSPQETGLASGDRFAFDAKHPGRQPLGHEADIRVSTLMEYTRRLPPIAGLTSDLADPPGIRLLAVGRYASDGRLGSMRDYAHRVMTPEFRRADDSLCDVIHWQRPGGGQVFAAPSIAAGWTLAVCSQWSGLMKNVLHHFGAVAETPTG
jgi:hypothetical protein